MNSVINVENLVKTFGGVPALSDVSFEVEPGTVFALLGENGAGKTTAIKIMLGLANPRLRAHPGAGPGFAPARESTSAAVSGTSPNGPRSTSGCASARSAGSPPPSTEGCFSNAIPN